MRTIDEWRALRGALPEKKMTNGDRLAPAQPHTRANVAFICELVGVKPRFNMMEHRVEVESPDGDGDAALAMVFDALEMLGIPLREKRTLGYLTLASQDARYHPMLTWIESAAWDGQDRLKALAASVPTASTLWPTYLRKWLIQTMEAVAGWSVDESPDRSLPHVLVFTGSQGPGKGRWVRRLAPGFVKADAELGLSGYQAKDNMIAVLRKPIVELGEIDSVFRVSEVSALKSFLSRPIDEVRGVYKELAPERARMTCFVGTVNDLLFLVDRSGSRRFWPVELTEGEDINFDHGIDMQQLWAQVLELWDLGEDWNLGDADDAAREEEAAQFTFVADEEEALDTHLRDHLKEYTSYYAMTIKEIKHIVGIHDNSHKGLKTVRGWLTRTLGKSKKLTCSDGHQRQNVWAFPKTGTHMARVTTPSNAVLGEKKAERHVKNMLRYKDFALDYTVTGDVIEGVFEKDDE